MMADDPIVFWWPGLHLARLLFGKQHGSVRVELSGLSSGERFEKTIAPDDPDGGWLLLPVGEEGLSLRLRGDMRESTKRFDAHPGSGEAAGYCVEAVEGNRRTSGVYAGIAEFVEHRILKNHRWEELTFAPVWNDRITPASTVWKREDEVPCLARTDAAGSLLIETSNRGILDKLHVKGSESDPFRPDRRERTRIVFGNSEKRFAYDYTYSIVAGRNTAAAWLVFDTQRLFGNQSESRWNFFNKRGFVFRPPSGEAPRPQWVGGASDAAAWGVRRMLSGIPDERLAAYPRRFIRAFCFAHGNSDSTFSEKQTMWEALRSVLER